MTMPLPLKTPLLCWHESLTSARNDALIALSPHGARIATTRPLPPGTSVFLELEGGAGIDAVTTDGDSAGFVVEFVTVDDAAAVLIERALRDSRVDSDDRAPLPPRTVTRPAAILSPPVVASAPVVTASVLPEGRYATTLVPMFAEEPAPIIASPPLVVVEAAPVIVEDAPVVVADAAPVIVEAAPIVVEAALVVVAAPPVMVEEAPVVVEAAPVVEAHEEISIADALRFELDDDDEGALAVPAPQPMLAVEAPIELPLSQTPPPSMIVEPFDDLHSDDLVDVAFGGFDARPANEADFERAFFANDDGSAPALPSFESEAEAKLDVDAQLAAQPQAPAAEPSGDLETEAAGFELPPDLPTFSTAPTTEPTLPRTRTDELFALQAASPETPLISAPIPPPTMSRTRTSSLPGGFDMPMTHPMGSLPLTFDAVPAAPAAPPPPGVFDPPPATAMTTSRETTDKWPSARGIVSLEDAAVAATPLGASIDHGPVVVDEVAPPTFTPAVFAPVVNVGDAEDVLLEFTDRRVHAVPAAEVERAQALLDGVGDAFAFDAFDDAIAAATTETGATRPTSPADEADVVGESAPAPEADVFAAREPDEETDVFAASEPDEPEVFAANEREHEHEAIDVEVEDDEVELDHRPAPTAYLFGPSGHQPVVDNNNNRPLPQPELEPEPEESSVGVVDVDFSEFKDVLGAAHRGVTAPSTLPAPPPSTLSSLTLPKPPPSPDVLRPPPFPRAPDSGEHSASLQTASASNPFGNPFGTDDSEARRLADSTPPPPSMPDDDAWHTSGPSTVFPAPRLLVSDLDPVLRAGGANSSAGTSSAPRALPFVGDSNLLVAALEPAESAPKPELTQLSPLPPRRPGSTSQPEELPIVVAADEDDLPVVGGQVLGDDDWQLGPDTVPGGTR